MDYVNYCYLHEDQEATCLLLTPGTPDGALWVCEECHNAELYSVLRQRLFEKYFREHADRIVANSVNRALRHGED